MPFLARSKYKGSARTNSTRRGSFETLEPRLTLSANLEFAGAFDIIGGSDSNVTSSFHDNEGGGLLTDAAGNRYVTVNNAFSSVGSTFEPSKTVDLDPGPGVRATNLSAGIVKLDPNGAVLWTAPLVGTGSGYPIVRTIATVDANQNVYLAGEFRGTLDFDPGPGVVNAMSTQAGSDYSCYMMKLNSAGQFQWIHTFDGNELQPRRVAADNNGNFLIEGDYFATTADPPLDVDAGPGQTFLQPVGSSGLVILKYDTNGNFVWARQFGGAAGAANPLNVAADSQGDVYVTGRYSGTVDLNPGAGVYTVVNNDSATDAFITRLNSNGDFVWAGATEGTGSTSFRGLEIAGDGSVIVAGGLSSPITVRTSSGSLPMTPVLETGNAFVLKFNSDSSINWARQFAAYTTLDASLDQQGNVYLGGSYGIAGHVAPTYDFDPGPGVYELVTPSTNETAYVLSLTGAGDFRWAVPLGGNTGRAQVQGISVAPNGDVQVSGAFRGTGDFDPDPASERWLASIGNNQTVFTATLTQSEPNPGAPVVDAGTSQSILVTGSATLHGIVTDDGLPSPVTTTWSLASGPGGVTFDDAAALNTTATFSTIGNYLLKLQATDGQFTTADYVQIVVNPVTAVFKATADAYIDGKKTTTNYGAGASLIVNGNPDSAALLSWNLNGIPAGSTLQSATLSINVTGTSANTYEIYELKRSWTELQATWNKTNAATNWQSAGAQGSLDRGSTVLGTVTASAAGVRSVLLNAAGLAVVQCWVNSPASNFGFILQDYVNTNKDDLAFSSKEATVAANRPQLQVVYVPPSAAPLSFSAATSSARAIDTGDIFGSKLIQTRTNGKVREKFVQPATASAKSQTPNLLLAAAPQTRRLPSEAVDSVLADFGDDGSPGWDDSLDDELLLALASAPSLRVSL